MISKTILAIFNSDSTETLLFSSGFLIYWLFNCGLDFTTLYYTIIIMFFIYYFFIYFDSITYYEYPKNKEIKLEPIESIKPEPKYITYPEALNIYKHILKNCFPENYIELYDTYKLEDDKYKLDQLLEIIDDKIKEIKKKSEIVVLNIEPLEEKKE